MIALPLIGCLALTLAVGHVALRAHVSVSFPYQLDPEEGFILDQAIRLHDGQSIYQPVDAEPWVAGTYAPLYQTLTAGLFYLVPPSLSWARTPAVAAELLCGVLVGLGVFILGRGAVVASLFSGLLFLACAEVHNWTGFARVDFLALAFNLAGLLCLSGRRPGLHGLRGALLFFILALFTKQSQIMAPLAACLYLIIRFPARGVLFSIVLGAVAAAIAISLNIWTGGEYLRHTITYNANAFYFDQLWTYATHLARFKLLVWIGLALALVADLLSFRHRDTAERESAELIERVDPWGDHDEATADLPREADWTRFYLPLCLLSLVGFAKAGVSFNYMIEPWAAICLYLGVRFARHLRPRPGAAWPSWRRADRLLMTAALIALIAHSIFIVTPNPRWGQTGDLNHPFRPRFTILQPPNPSAIDLAQGREVEAAVSAVQLEGRDFLTELPVFETRLGLRARWQPFIMAQLAREGKWDPAPLVEDITAGRFALIVTTEPVDRIDYDPKYTAEIIDAIRERYYLAQEVVAPQTAHVFDYYLFRPRGAATSDSAEATGAPPLFIVPDAEADNP